MSENKTAAAAAFEAEELAVTAAEADNAAEKEAKKAKAEAAKKAKEEKKAAEAEAAKEAEADPWQEMRTIVVPKRYPKDKGRTVRVNGGVKYTVPCGRPVEVPLPIYDVLMHSIETRSMFEDMLDGLNGSDTESR